MRAGLGNIIVSDDHALFGNVYLQLLQSVANRSGNKVVCADKTLGMTAEFIDFAFDCGGIAVVEFVAAQNIVPFAMCDTVYRQRLYHAEIALLKAHAVRYVADKAKLGNAVLFMQLTGNAVNGFGVVGLYDVEITRYRAVGGGKVDKANGQLEVYKLCYKILVKCFYRDNAVDV